MLEIIVIIIISIIPILGIIGAIEAIHNLKLYKKLKAGKTRISRRIKKIILGTSAEDTIENFFNNLKYN